MAMKTSHKKNSLKRRQTQKRKNKQTGGAIYTFNFNDKIGGQPAWIPLNGTKDGDCPSTNTKELGFVNYETTRSSGGGKRNKQIKKHMRSQRRSK